MIRYLLLQSSSMLTSLLLAGVAMGGTLNDYPAGTPNNDDYAGTYSDSPNEFGLGLLVLEVDEVFHVVDSGGTTEYQYDVAFLGAGGGETEYSLQLGFGTGDNFVSASEVFSDLDFDAPLPGEPVVTSSVFSVIDRHPHVVNFSGGSLPNNAFAALRVSFDVPDLPASVLEHYTSEELANLPAGATAFTLRHQPSLVPEPSTIVLATLAICTVRFSIRRREQRRCLRR